MCIDSVTVSGHEPGNLTKEIGGVSHVQENVLTHSVCGAWLVGQLSVP